MTGGTGSTITSWTITTAIVYMLVAMAFGSVTVTGHVIDDFDGQGHVDLMFDGPGHRILDISVPDPSLVMEATMNISGHPLDQLTPDHPSNVSVDVGDDGEVEWAFSGMGYGPLGRQGLFKDGTSSMMFNVTAGLDTTVDVLLPGRAVITDASLTLTGSRSPTEELSRVLPNLTAPPSSSTNHTVEGVTDDKVPENGTIVLEDAVGVEEALDLDQFRSNSAFSLDVDMYSAQNFRINSTDPKQKEVNLYSVEVFITHVSPADAGLELRIYNTTDDADHKPTGDPIANRTLWIQDIPNNDYSVFTFDTPVLLEPDTIYSMVMRERYTLGTGDYFDVVFQLTISGGNADTPYPVPGCWMLSSPDKGSSWFVEDNKDWRFRTRVDIARPLTSGERDDVLVDGLPPAQVVGDDLHYPIPDPVYYPLGWNISVTNQLPIPVLFNLSANTSFHDLPSSISVDIGDDDDIEFERYDDLEGQVQVGGMVQALSDAMAAGSKTLDDHGNEMTTVRIGVGSSGNGSIGLEELCIEYDLEAPVPGMVDAIETFRSAHRPEGDRDLVVPINVSSDTPGHIRLTDLFILYDGPPEVVTPYPTGLTLKEESLNLTLLDINDIFTDEHDTGLDYTIHDISVVPWDDIPLSVQISDARYLSVDATGAINWSGQVVVRINATDDNGYITTSGPINVTVEDVNDPPVITSSPMLIAFAGETFEYLFYFDDSDDDSHYCWIEDKPEGMTLDEGNRTIRWIPLEDDIGDREFTLRVSDGYLEDSQTIPLMVRSGGGANERPVVQDIPLQKVIVNDQLKVQVVAYDPEQVPLEFTLAQGPEGMTVDNMTGQVRWTPVETGNFSVVIRVSDRYLWSDVTFQVTVLEEGTPIAQIELTIENPERDETISRYLILTGRVSAQGTTISKVEYKIDDHDWEQADLGPGGTWSAAPSITDLKKGPHTVVVRATAENGDMEQTYTTFVLKASGGPDDGNAGLASLGPISYVLLFIAILAAVVAGAILSRGRSRKGKGARKGTGTGPDKEEVLSTSRSEGDVDSAFLVYHDGRLITYSSRGEIEDPYTTLEVIKDFVKASFRGDVGKLDSLRYEGMNIILERGIQMYLVVITPGEDHKGLRRRMRAFLHDVHEQHRSVLKVWDGKFKKVKGIATMVEDFVNRKWTSEHDGKEGEGEKAKEAPPSGGKSERWDESPDLDGKDLSKIEKLKIIEDKFTRGEITEKEHERLKRKIG